MIGDALLQKTMTIQYPSKCVKNNGLKPKYYVENCLPAIITREKRDAVLTLMASKHTSEQKYSERLLSKMLKCSDCGHSYRWIKIHNGEIVWQCSYRNRGVTNCRVYTVNEDDICKTFICTVNKLRKGRREILLPLIERMEIFQSKLNNTETKVNILNSEIATVSKQQYVISQLLANGILDTSDFATQSTELSNKLSDLRKKRREFLKQNDTDEAINKLRELYDILDEMENDLNQYDDELIRSVIEYATVISDTELKIRLIGGLEITEYLPKYNLARCKLN